MLTDIATATLDFGFNAAAADHLLAAAADMAPLLRAHSAEAEGSRSFPAPVRDALETSGLWNMLLPRRCGGFGMSSTGFAHVIRELAKGDPSVGWVVQVINNASWAAALMPDTVQEALFANGPKRVCGGVAPAGTAHKVTGGYRVSGAWPYSSGTRYAQWVQGTVLIEDEGASVVHMVYMDKTQVDVADSWDVTGLQGTGSDTNVATDVFVPSERVVPIDRMFSGAQADRKHGGEASDYLSVYQLTRATLVAQIVGAAHAQAQIVIEGAARRGVAMTSYTKQMDSPVAQHQIGEAMAKIDAAWLLVLENCNEIDRLALLRSPMSPADAARNRARIGLAVELCLQASDRLMSIAGSSAFSSSNLAQRYWRDINLAARHGGHLPHVAFEVYGRDLLGITPNIVPQKNF